MQAAMCADGRTRGCFQFYGANRTGRFSGRLIQLQNLPQNHLPDLEAARELVRAGDYDVIEMLYGSVPEVLSELIRTAFIAPEGKLFYVADFSAIEARVIAWLAHEDWRAEVFKNGGDIYCASASAMFHVPVEKHGINGHLRQKGKIAELALGYGGCGLACVGKVFYEAMIIAYGDGRNGKSTFWNTVFRVMGSYAKTISAETLTTSCKRNTLPEMAELKGCRLVLASELKEGLSMNTSVVKQLTSTDPIHAEKKYFAPFDFQPTHTLVLYTNHLPKVRALDAGIWRRLIVVPFNARIEGKGDIKNYSDYLVEHAGGAVMKWILEGAQKVIAADYRVQEPEIVQTAIAEYRENNDWLRPFLEEKCDVGKQYREASGQFYMHFRA